MYIYTHALWRRTDAVKQLAANVYIAQRKGKFGWAAAKGTQEDDCTRKSFHPTIIKYNMYQSIIIIKNDVYECVKSYLYASVVEKHELNGWQLVLSVYNHALMEVIYHN